MGSQMNGISIASRYGRLSRNSAIRLYDSGPPAANELTPRWKRTYRPIGTMPVSEWSRRRANCRREAVTSAECVSAMVAKPAPPAAVRFTPGWTRSSEVELGHRLLDVRRRGVERLLLLARQLDLYDLLDAARSQLDRHAHVDVRQPVLPLEPGGAGQDPVAVAQDRLRHLHHGGRRSVERAPAAQKLHDLPASLPGAVDQRLYTVLRQKVRERDPGHCRIARQRDHRVAVPTQY